MDYHAVLNKYRGLVLVHDQDAIYMVSETLRKLKAEAPTKDDQDKLVTQDRLAGRFILRELNEVNRAYDARGCMFECVLGLLIDDHVDTVYRQTSIFNSRQALINARCELIATIAKAKGYPVGRLMLTDSERGRNVILQELSTAQLVDHLANLLNPILVAKSPIVFS